MKFHLKTMSHDDLRETRGGAIAEVVMGANSRLAVDEFVRCMLTAHRSNQQDFARLALRYLCELANDEFGHDDRNEAAVAAAKKVREAIGEFGWALPGV